MHLSPAKDPPLPSISRPLGAARRSRVRRGVTLVELLVVILLLGITAALVLPALTPPGAQAADATAALLTRARKAAIRRGESLRLNVATDGAWALVTVRDGAELETGRLPVDEHGTEGVAAHATAADATPLDAQPRVDVTIDALGSCRPASRAAAEQRFDPLACAWLPTNGGRIAVGVAGNP